MDQDCPLCPQNGLLKEEIIAKTDRAYLIRAFNSPGNHLIIPMRHTETLNDLPDNWWQEVKSLLAHTPNLNQYNLSVNMGQNAGQTVKHVHFWVVPRAGGQPASGKGLARLIGEANNNVR